ncbi:MAG: NADH-quinone oxidoreductase subunit E [Gammaproteobacteria bacterium]|nr:MAG: NADH-quinone oxidoreductase subunit E [Gammaproteobacteria bacterium]
MASETVQAALPPAVVERIERAAAKFPPGWRQSAVLEALTAVQEHNGGHLTVPLMDAVAEVLGMPPVAVYEVAGFYSMLETEPVGRHCIAVCTNLSCMLRGAEAIVAHLERRLGVRLGQSTPDGFWYLKREEECLAACCAAPVMQIDHRYHERLTPEAVDAILDDIEREAGR